MRDREKKKKENRNNWLVCEQKAKHSLNFRFNWSLWHLCLFDQQKAKYNIQKQYKFIMCPRNSLNPLKISEFFFYIGTDFIKQIKYGKIQSKIYNQNEKQ